MFYKILTWFLGDWTEWVGTLLQMLCALILIPMIVLVLSVVAPGIQWDYLFNAMSKLPLVGTCFELVGMLWGSRAIDGSGLMQMLDTTYMLVNNQTMEAAIVGMCSFCVACIFKLVGMRGIPFLENMFGLVLGTLILITFFPNGAPFDVIFLVIGLMFLSWVLCLVCTRGQWPQKIYSIISVAFEMFLSACGFLYVGWIFLALTGQLTWMGWESFWDVVLFIEMVSFPYVLVLTIRYLTLPKRCMTLLNMLFPNFKL